MEEKPIKNNSDTKQIAPDKQNKLALILYAIIILAFGFLIGYIARGIEIQNTQQPREPNKPATITQLKANAILLPTITKEQSIYVNKSYGFAMIYPKFERGQGTEVSCSGNPVAYEVFEDTSNNSLYIAPTTIAEFGNTTNCHLIKTSLDVFKNVVDNGERKSSLGLSIYPGDALVIKYAKINNNDDLNNFVHSMYGKGCYAKNWKPDKDLGGVVDYTIVDSNGGVEGPGDTEGFAKALNGGCVANFGFIFLYSPSKKVAIISNAFQNGPLFGTNNQYSPTFSFLP